MKKTSILTILLAAAVLYSTSCGSPAPSWLAGPATVQELLDGVEGLGNLALAANQNSVLIAGSRKQSGDVPLVCFAVEATPEGTITNRTVLTALEPDQELLDIEAGCGGDGNADFAVVVVVERASAGDAALFWEIPAGGQPSDVVQLELAATPGEQIALRDLHIVHISAEAFLFYGADAFASAENLNSAMLLTKIGEQPVTLGRYPSTLLWEITRTAVGGGNIAIARSWREEEVFATALSLFDSGGSLLAGPRVLFTAKYLFDTVFTWDALRKEFALLWGTSHRYWFQRIALEEGELKRRLSPSVEIRFDAAVTAIRPETERYIVVLQDGHRLFSRPISTEGEFAGDARELVGIGETGNRRLHVLAHAWCAGRLAVLLSFGENFAYRLLQP